MDRSHCYNRWDMWCVHPRNGRIEGVVEERVDQVHGLDEPPFEVVYTLGNQAVNRSVFDIL